MTCERVDSQVCLSQPIGWNLPVGEKRSTLTLWLRPLWLAINLTDGHFSASSWTFRKEICGRTIMTRILALMIVGRCKVWCLCCCPMHPLLLPNASYLPKLSEESAWSIHPRWMAWKWMRKAGQLVRMMDQHVYWTCHCWTAQQSLNSSIKTNMQTRINQEFQSKCVWTHYSSTLIVLSAPAVARMPPLEKSREQTGSLSCQTICSVFTRIFCGTVEFNFKWSTLTLDRPSSGPLGTQKTTNWNSLNITLTHLWLNDAMNDSMMHRISL